MHTRQRHFPIDLPSTSSSFYALDNCALVWNNGIDTGVWSVVIITEYSGQVCYIVQVYRWTRLMKVSWLHLQPTPVHFPTSFSALSTPMMSCGNSLLPLFKQDVFMPPSILQHCTVVNRRKVQSSENCWIGTSRVGECIGKDWLRISLRLPKWLLKVVGYIYWAFELFWLLSSCCYWQLLAA